MDPDDVMTPTNEVVKELVSHKDPNSSKDLPLPPALTTAEQVQIKVLGQAPAHPGAKGA